MSKKEKEDRKADLPQMEEEAAPFRVEDRRHWARGGDDGPDATDTESEPASTRPSIIDEMQQRAETAERQLQEYIAAFKKSREDMEAARERLSRDVGRRVELQFGELVGDLLEAVDDLDRALSHVEGVDEAAPLAEGVGLARDRFLATLARHGIERIDCEDEEFDPNLAEAVRVDPVDPSRDGRVTEILRPGYRLGDRVIRAARVAVGRAAEPSS